ncbi:PDZ domain-containing protein [Cellulophaga sp. HaHaR_3_176]|uniref:S41 family peptidase n=1 Tax=Cellulophaga sp. HaHaR_3_176 TaxID=1942464 RepID=UPI001C1FF139|nr:S41 family peptidase [Cellulophaga sp. HaHaR_3_176]QWX82620.1 PDZ domain-containing protein [Cellulophaga sp. HaHaR_3_176]
MKKYLLLLIGLSLLTTACSDKDDEVIEEIVNVELNNEVNEFIWQGMNYWYFWQADKNDLADDRFATADDFHSYLNGYSSSEALFNDLVYQPGVVDDFSWYIPNVDEQLDSFRGISKSYGIGFPRALIRANATDDDVVIFIAYVEPNSPAAAAGLKRGDIIHRVDGVRMDVDNAAIINKVFSEENLSVGLCNIVDGVVVPIDGEIQMSAEIITSNPIHHYEVIEEGGKKIGYLVYNSFNATFNGELNDVFDFFKAQGVNEMVLDLRYNGGGSVLSSGLLASMIDGDVAEGTAFARLQYNSKRDENEGFTYPFLNDNYLYDKTTSDFIGTESMSRLQNINRLYVLTGEGTASASEMIINGLRPYIPVKIIGEKTVGKNEGSITVVDSAGDFTDLENRNPNHTIGMQPIVFQVYNSRNESDYTAGFQPDILVEEAQFTADIKAFGDPEEALLRTALNDMLGTSTSKFSLNADSNMKATDTKIKLPKFSYDMYLLDDEININF